MNFDPALDGLLDLLAEAIVRKLETRIPATPTGNHNEVPLGKGEWSDERLPDDPG